MRELTKFGLILKIYESLQAYGIFYAKSEAIRELLRGNERCIAGMGHVVKLVQQRLPKQDELPKHKEHLNTICALWLECEESDPEARKTLFRIKNDLQRIIVKQAKFCNICLN